MTVSNVGSQTIEQVRQRLLESRARAANGEAHATRLPQRPDELMLRLLNAMVDRYLELRQPLTERLERWQRELLERRILPAEGRLIIKVECNRARWPNNTGGRQ